MIKLIAISLIVIGVAILGYLTYSHWNDVITVKICFKFIGPYLFTEVGVAILKHEE